MFYMIELNFALVMHRKHSEKDFKNWIIFDDMINCTKLWKIHDSKPINGCYYFIQLQKLKQNTKYNFTKFY